MFAIGGYFRYQERHKVQVSFYGCPEAGRIDEGPYWDGEARDAEYHIYFLTVYSPHSDTCGHTDGRLNFSQDIFRLDFAATDHLTPELVDRVIKYWADNFYPDKIDSELLKEHECLRGDATVDRFVQLHVQLRDFISRQEAKWTLHSRRVLDQSQFLLVTDQDFCSFGVDYLCVNRLQQEYLQKAALDCRTWDLSFKSGENMWPFKEGQASVHFGWLVPPWLVVKKRDSDGRCKLFVCLPSNECATYAPGHARWSYIVALFSRVWKSMALPMFSS